MILINIRSPKSRVMFNTLFPDWRECMDTCTKYNEAQAPSFTSWGEFEDMLHWYRNTTLDPVTSEPYEYGGKFWWVATR